LWVHRWQGAGVAAVACGSGLDTNACAILEDGPVECMADRQWDATDVRVCGGRQVSGGDTFAEISCGHYYCCGLRTDGTATCRGDPALADPPPPDFP
jgi:hypothetical protein